MFHEEYTALCNAGVAKNNLLKKNPLGYFISSMVAGMFISFGSMVAFVLGQSMDGNGAAAAVKLIQSIAFASALSLVVMAGAELFTGNNLVMAAASLRKKVSWADTVKLWCVCWIGNLIASLLCVAAFQLTGQQEMEQSQIILSKFLQQKLVLVSERSWCVRSCVIFWSVLQYGAEPR